jgi:hypothetical protein
MPDPEPNPTTTDPSTNPNPPAATPPAPAQPTPPTTPTPSGQPADDKAIKLTPAQLNERLERAKLATLKGIGWDGDEASAKAAIEAHKAQLEAEKSEVERLRDEVAKLKPGADAYSALSEAAAVRAKATMSTLTEEQQGQVVAIAGDDPQRIMAAVDALKPAWDKASEAPAPPALPAPTTTTPAPGPAPGSAPPEQSVVATYEALRKTNPVAAANFKLQPQNYPAIQAAQSGGS